MSAGRRGPACALFLSLLGPALLAPVCAATEPGDLLPEPRVLLRASGRCRLDAATRVASERPLDDEFAIHVITALIDSSGRAARAAPGGPARAMRRVVFRSGPVRLPDGGSVAGQTYSVRVSGDSLVITGPTAAARLHGAETVRQLANEGGGLLPACTIVDGPALAVRGLSLDISRGRVPTAAEFTRILDVLAAFKLNVLQLYIEDTYPFSGVPKDALRGYALSPATLRSIAHEARRRSIALVPIVQTLGHQERMLSHASMREHSEMNAPRSDWERMLLPIVQFIGRVFERVGISAATARVPSAMFAPGEPKTQRLVRSMVDDVLEASGAGAIHIGCDEATEIGRGASAAEARRRGVDGVYLEHVRRLAEHARSRWGATTWVYDDFLLQHPALLDSLPANMVLVDWHYDPAAGFGSLDSLRSVAPDRIVTSAGLWNWYAIYPSYAKALPNIRNATSAARSHGGLGTILASWGDGGSEDLFGNDLFGLAYFADRAWNPAANERPDFAATYCRARFGRTAAVALPVYRALTTLELPSVGYNQQLVHHPVLVRERTPRWKAAVLALNREMRTALAAVPRIRPVDTYAGAELEALASTVHRFLAATERELTLDSLAIDVAAANTPSGARRARQGEALARVLAWEERAEAMYGAAWLAHNDESELGVVLARLGRQRVTLDSLRRAALAGRLEVPRRFRRGPDAMSRDSAR